MEKREWNKEAAWLTATAAGLAVASFGFFQLAYAYHFFFKGQNQLFLMSWDYAAGLLAKPAWAACLAGEFLTQFYYYDYAGAAILALSLLALMWLAYKAARHLRARWWMALAVALAVAVREASCHLYFGYTLSSTCALAGGLLMFLALHRPMRRRWPWALAAVLAGASACHWMFGYGVWIFLLLSAIAAWRAGVPAALAFAALLPLARSHYNLSYEGLCEYPGVGSLHKPAWLIETDLHIMHSYQTGDWDDVTATAEADPLLNSLTDRLNSQVTLSADDRTSSSVRQFFYNLVQAQRGRLPDVLLNYYPNYLGTFTSMTGQKIPMMLFMNLHEFYFAVGDISYAERGAFMSCVCVPGNKNAYDIKRLAECALVTGDQAAAEKYLGLLRQTIPYKDWAATARSDKRYQEKAQYTNRQDTVSPSDNSHRILTELLQSNPDNVAALDYMLCSLLLVKEIDNFKRDYDRFCSDRPRLKKLYQEALCIWLASHNASEEEWRHYIKDEQVMNRLREYMAEGPGARYADTYWHYYDTFNFEAY